MFWTILLHPLSCGPGGLAWSSPLFPFDLKLAKYILSLTRMAHDNLKPLMPSELGDIGQQCQRVC
jgi:hypothetical protein